MTFEGKARSLKRASNTSKALITFVKSINASAGAWSPEGVRAGRCKRLLSSLSISEPLLNQRVKYGPSTLKQSQHNGEKASNAVAGATLSNPAHHAQDRISGIDLYVPDHSFRGQHINIAETSTFPNSHPKGEDMTSPRRSKSTYTSFLVLVSLPWRSDISLLHGKRNDRQTRERISVWEGGSLDN